MYNYIKSNHQKKKKKSIKQNLKKICKHKIYTCGFTAGNEESVHLALWCWWWQQQDIIPFEARYPARKADRVIFSIVFNKLVNPVGVVHRQRLGVVLSPTTPLPPLGRPLSLEVFHQVSQSFVSYPVLKIKCTGYISKSSKIAIKLKHCLTRHDFFFFFTRENCLLIFKVFTL